MDMRFEKIIRIEKETIKAEVVEEFFDGEIVIAREKTDSHCDLMERTHCLFEGKEIVEHYIYYILRKTQKKLKLVFSGLSESHYVYGNGEFNSESNPVDNFAWKMENGNFIAEESSEWSGICSCGTNHYHFTYKKGGRGRIKKIKKRTI